MRCVRGRSSSRIFRERLKSLRKGIKSCDALSASRKLDELAGLVMVRWESVGMPMALEPTVWPPDTAPKPCSMRRIPPLSAHGSAAYSCLRLTSTPRVTNRVRKKLTGEDREALLTARDSATKCSFWNQD